MSEQSHGASATPYELAIQQGQVELRVQPGSVEAETMVDALAVNEHAYQERLAEPHLDPDERTLLRVKTVVSQDLRATLRGRTPYEEDPAAAAFRDSLRLRDATPAEPARRWRFARRIGGIPLRQQSQATGRQQRTASQTAEPVLYGSEVSFVLEALRDAPDILDQEVSLRSDYMPVPPSQTEDTVEARKQRGAEAARLWNNDLESMRDRALAMRNLYEEIQL